MEGVELLLHCCDGCHCPLSTANQYDHGNLLQENLKARLDAELDSKAQAIASAQVEEEVSHA